ncbi:hypothetical protein [Alienimonas chondri]|uniref:Lipoprotein n=1 Tax=Alienimonas chondri TaxID=2681879 RepID=A0ABX1VA44_9PLAN|nr:hypothetical protein [Alienimonas chondri]NNJ24152.1 hypothetical protein [Alienimonas chondri]
MPRPRLRPAISRWICSFPACLAVTALAGLLSGCGADEKPAASVERPPADPAPVRVAAAGDEFVLPVPPPLQEQGAAPASVVDRLPGTYTRESYGTRTLTVRDDGTATMKVDVDPLYQWMAGAKTITVQIDWELTDAGTDENPGVHFESVSGTPKESFESVTSLFGSERDWTITSADDESLVLFSPEDEETEIWTRITDESAG